MILITYLIPLIIFVGFGFLHSYTAKTSVKNSFRKRFPLFFSYYRIIYNIGSLFYFLLFGWSLPGKDIDIYIIPFPWILLFTFFMMWGFWIAWRSFRHFDTLAFLGIRQLSESADVNKYAEYNVKLSISGWYKYVRHPLYFGCLLGIWFWPFMTVAWFQMALYVTLYFIIGSKHEEKLLLERFGESYRNYQKQTKRLIPFIY